MNSIFYLSLFFTLLSISNSAKIPAPNDQDQDQVFISESQNSADASSCNCGDRNEEDRIVGGRDANLGEFPWRCGMFLEQWNGMTLFCGCSVISENYVLTAAHCTHAVPGRQIYVDAGDYDLTRKTEIENQVIKVSEVIEHEKYNGANHNNDVSLLKLEKPLNFSRTVSPVCLPWKFANSTFKNATVVASGSGTTKEGGKVSDILQTVDLPLLTTEECQGYYGTKLISDNMICTYEPGKDTCQGDSGSSIDYKDTETGQYYAVGVVSWGMGCGRKEKPGVYAKLSKYMSWIVSKTIGENFCKA